MMGKQYFIPAVVFAIVLFVSKTQAAEPTDASHNYIGINAGFNNDYNGCNAFVDMIKHARDWYNYEWTGNATVDTDGWPTEDCSNVVFGSDNSTGIYKLIFEGSAKSIAVAWTPGSVANISYDTASNTSTADVTLSGTVLTGILRFQGTMRTAASAINTGIRNVRLYRPGYPVDGSAVFTNEWLGLVRKFHVVRFMDWVNTNTNPIVSWSHRLNPRMSQIPPNTTYNGRSGPAGVAMEHFIELCNATNTDLWINIPTFADSEYVAKTAQLILYGSNGRDPYASLQTSPVYPPLNPNLKVYVEYANEVWNGAGGFMCFKWIKAITDSILAVAQSTHPILYGGKPDEWRAIARYAAWKTVEISKNMRMVFGDTAMMTRVRPVLMGQLGGNWCNPEQLPFIDALYATHRPATDPCPNTDPKPVDYYLYGAGGSSYYQVNTWSASPDAFFAAGNSPEDAFVPNTARDAIWATNYGLKRIAYEGGMGLDGSWSATDDQKRVINADPRMKDLTVACHDLWSANGGDLLTYFVMREGSSPNWEFTPSVYKPDSPKLQAIDKLRDTLHRVDAALGGTAPCTVTVQSQVDRNTLVKAGLVGPATQSGETVMSYINAGEWVACPVSARQAGWYRLSARCGANTAGSVDLWLNGAKVATHQVSGTLVNTPYVTVQLRRGLNVMRFQPTSGEAFVHSFMLAASDTNASDAAISVVKAALSTKWIVRSASGALVAHINGPVQVAESSYDLFSMSGQRLCGSPVGPGETAIVLPCLHSGMYLLRLRSGNLNNYMTVMLAR